MRSLLPWLALLVLVALVGWAVVKPRSPAPPSVGPQASPAAASQAPAAVSPVEVVAEGLEVPWALAFAPDGTLYVTERPGRLARIRAGKPETVETISDVSERQESGLLGLALDPDFAENERVYLYYTSRQNVNRVVQYRLTETGLTEEKVLLDNIPAAPLHDGGRIAFGPDGNLYVTTGDATDPEQARNPESLAGKILRVRSDGGIPDNNPFPGSPVYSLGHRNPQGLAWAADGALYATEHGPSARPPDCCHDEVNRIEAGKDYGWPLLAGAAVRGDPLAHVLPGDLVKPIAESGPEDTWAPGGAAVVGNTLVFVGLRGEALFKLDLGRPDRGVTAHFAGQFGRLRDVVVGPDGALYITTSNRDGRGRPRPGDDKILRVDPAALR